MATRKVFDGKLLKVFKSDVTLPHGRKASIEKVKHPGAALIVAFVGGQTVLIRQFRPVLSKYIWELPAGTLEPGESPYACAKREITEETGYRVRRLKRLGSIYTTPGFCDEVIHIFRAECVSKDAFNMDEDEIIRVKTMKPGEIRRLFKNGKIKDSKTIAALAFSGVL